jgi:hypothetical protein
MEILQRLFQQRVQALAQTFLRLLQQLELALTPLSAPALSHLRTDYLAHLIAHTLQDDRERYVQQLALQIQHLETRNLSLLDAAKSTRLSNCSRESATPLQDSGKSWLTRNPSSLEQTYVETESESSVESLLKRRGVGSHSQTSIQEKRVSRLRQEEDGEGEGEGEGEEEFEFKYLRIGRQN